MWKQTKINGNPRLCEVQSGLKTQPWWWKRLVYVDLARHKLWMFHHCGVRYSNIVKKIWKEKTFHSPQTVFHQAKTWRQPFFLHMLCSVCLCSDCLLPTSPPTHVWKRNKKKTDTGWVLISTSAILQWELYAAHSWSSVFFFLTQHVHRIRMFCHHGNNFLCFPRNLQRKTDYFWALVYPADFLFTKYPY